MQEGPEAELLRGLSTGSLPPFTLVWRAGWAGWIPAMEVEALSRAIPTRWRGSVRRLPRADGTDRVPRVPVSEYPRLRRVARENHRNGEVSGARPLPSVSPPPWAERESQHPQAAAITSRVPPAVLQGAVVAMNAPEPPPNLGMCAATAERAESERVRKEEAPPTQHDLAIPLMPSAESLAVEFGLPREHQAQPSWAELLESSEPARKKPWLSGLLPAVSRYPARWAAVAAAALGIAFYTAWPHDLPPSSEEASGEEPSGEEPSGAESSGAESSGLADGPESARVAAGVGAEPPEQAAVLSPACHPLGAPVALGARAAVEVPPALALVPELGRVAVGFAQGGGRAVGLLLDPGTLEFERPFAEAGRRSLYSVEPLVEREARVVFHAERAGAEMSFGRVLPTHPPLRVGVGEEGLVIGGLKGAAKALWRLPRGSLVALPSIAALPPTDQAAAAGAPGRFLMATRVGKRRAAVRAGIFDERGRPLTPLRTLELPRGPLGRPVVAAGEKGSVLAVVVPRRGGPGHELLLAKASNGQVPGEPRPLDVFDSRVELSAPALAALPHSAGYVLAWSEGGGAERRVRLLKLSSALEPVGPPVDITERASELQGATVGSLYHIAPAQPVEGEGEHLLLFYFVGRGAGSSLWVSDIACQPVQVAL